MNLVHSHTAVLKFLPTVLAKLKDVEVSVDAYHDGTDDATGFKDEDPDPIAKKENPENEFYCASRCFDVVHVIV